jgi:glycosyltransferase involved in cell wall biosynthesis
VFLAAFSGQWEALPAEPPLLVQLFAYHFPPSSASGAARPGRWAKYLPQFGVRCRVTAQWTPVSISTGHTAYVNPEDARGAWRAGLLLCRLLHRLAPYNEQWPWIPAALRQASEANRAEPAQAVVSTFPPLAGHIAGLLFHRRFGVPWIADFRDPLAGSPFRNRPWAGPYDRMLEAAVFRHAAAVIVTNDAVAERFRELHPRHAGKIHVLWNGFDPEEPAVRPAPDSAPRRLVHAGSLYGPRKPDTLLRALDRLLGAGRLAPGAWRVEFIGPHDEGTFVGCAGAVERLANAGIVEIRGGLRPRRDLEGAMAKASLLLLLDLTGEERSVQVPAKLFEYVRTGLPVVAWSPPGSPTRHVLERAGIASLVFEPGEDEEAVAARLAAWLEDPPPAAAPSGWFLETFDGARQAEWLARLIRTVAAGKSATSASDTDAAASK